MSASPMALTSEQGTHQLHNGSRSVLRTTRETHPCAEDPAAYRSPHTGTVATLPPAHTECARLAFQVRSLRLACSVASGGPRSMSSLLLWCFRLRDGANWLIESTRGAPAGEVPRELHLARKQSSSCKHSPSCPETGDPGRLPSQNLHPIPTSSLVLRAPGSLWPLHTRSRGGLFGLLRAGLWPCREQTAPELGPGGLVQLYPHSDHRLGVSGGRSPGDTGGSPPALCSSEAMATRALQALA